MGRGGIEGRGGGGIEGGVGGRGLERRQFLPILQGEEQQNLP